MKKIHALELFPEDIDEIIEEFKLPTYVGTQVLDWIYKKQVASTDEMTNISKNVREIISSKIELRKATLIREQRSSDGTKKQLLSWGIPKKETETVMIPAKGRRTVCVSSQIGCPVGCTFCASGLNGLDGNLKAGQIVEQVVSLNANKITNVVFMGMGEPLANYTNVTKAIRILNAKWGLGIGSRKITVSTVGLPQAIERLAKFEIPITLALSLHAPNDEIRKTLIPWAKFAPIQEILHACDIYFKNTGREITLEYLLLNGINDRVKHAKELITLCKSLRCNVNLIRYNEVPSLPFIRPEDKQVRIFQNILAEGGVNSHIRASRGRDIAAACGQLKRQENQITIEEST